MNKIINYKNFNKKKINKFNKDFKSLKPFPHIIIDNFLNEKFAHKLLNHFTINKNWINYSFVNNFKKYGFNDRKKMNKELNLLFNSLGSKKFLNEIYKITDINRLFLDSKLDGGGLHQIFNGGYLNIHTDFRSHTNKPNWKRVLNILIYLNYKWKKKYNGNLELWSTNGKKKVKDIFPKFNRCVIFLTNHKSYHGHPVKLNCPDNVSRKSVAAYYFVKEKQNLKLNPTNYISRPSDSLKNRFLIGLDTNLNRLYSLLKRKNILNDKKVTKILNFLSK